VPRLGFPGLCLNDNSNGIRVTDYINAFPGGLSIAASWNAPLAEQRARFLGAEFRTKGISVSLGPVVSPLGRLALDGRLWEGLGADPYLAGVMAAKSIIGVQSQNVIACVKHLIAYEQETLRQASKNANGTAVAAYSSNLDDKTMHEIYLWPFMDAVRAGAGSVMCSYERVNNSYACQNSKVMNGLIKEELGFQGFVVSDWAAEYGGIAGAKAGLDMVMPEGAQWANLTGAVANGTLAESRLDDMIVRTMAAWYLTEQDTKAAVLGIGMPGPGPTAPHTKVNAIDPAAKGTIFDGAVEGHVLVKNNGALPLKCPGLLSVFGYAAATPRANNPSSSFIGVNDWSLGVQTANVSELQALLEVAIAGVNRSQPFAPGGALIYGGGTSNQPFAFLNGTLTL
jgi:beta-glucosidase